MWQPAPAQLPWSAESGGLVCPACPDHGIAPADAMESPSAYDRLRRQAVMTSVTTTVGRADEENKMNPIKVAEARLPGPVHGTSTLRDDGGSMALPIDRIGVDTDCVELGLITLSARGPDPQDAYGYEFDLDADAALRLADALSAAAVMIEPTTRARDDTDS